MIGETLDPGDIDEFVVHLTAGDTVQVGMDSDPPGSDFQADVVIAGLFQWRGPSRPAQTLIITPDGRLHDLGPRGPRGGAAGAGAVGG